MAFKHESKHGLQKTCLQHHNTRSASQLQFAMLCLHASLHRRVLGVPSWSLIAHASAYHAECHKVNKWLATAYGPKLLQTKTVKTWGGCSPTAPTSWLLHLIQAYATLGFGLLFLALIHRKNLMFACSYLLSSISVSLKHFCNCYVASLCCRAAWFSSHYANLFTMLPIFCHGWRPARQVNCTGVCRSLQMDTRDNQLTAAANSLASLRTAAGLHAVTDCVASKTEHHHSYFFLYLRDAISVSRLRCL